ncbi:hypothetical protein AB2L27_17255 [Kineococcus sp. LSe6-4]|uniref:Uncharacterized protein n=1 Tax=Kineococcus halophytocola TaxID=3234027 RepID=A0ABV4H4L5_9ACTN
MRLVLVPPLAAVLLALTACGAGAASPAAGTPTDVPTTAPDVDVWTPSPEQIAHEEWLQAGPPATSMPTRTCTRHEPTEEELATTDPDDLVAVSGLSWTSCFDPSAYPGASPCTPPPDLAEGQAFLCVEGPRLTQRVVDDWNAFVDAEDRAAAGRMGMGLEEYRARYVDDVGGPSVGSSVGSGVEPAP